MEFYPRERKREEQRERERGRREEGAGGLGARQTGERERRGGEGVFMVPTQGSKIPLDLN